MKKQLINGHWVDALHGGIWKVQNPATEEFFAEVPYGDEADGQRAIEAAATAFPSWSSLSPWTRAEVLKRAADCIRRHTVDFATETVMECGKPKAEAEGEWKVAADLFEWFAEEGKRAYGRIIPAKRTDRRMLVILQPMGVIGVITAWNFPAYNPARACAAALAAGCTIVCKGSEFTPLSSMNLFTALQEAGIPDGVANLVNGDAAKIGKAMLDDPNLRKISFTGSTRVGKILMDGASRTGTKLALEMGGNAPVIIMDDVDVEQVAKSAVSGRFRNAGQVCNIPQRFYVHRSVYDYFLAAVSAHAAALKTGNGLEAETRMGPLVNRKQMEQVLAVIDEAKKEGAEVTAGGAGADRGFFVQPTVIADRNGTAHFYGKEIFGPVMPVIPFDTREEVIEKANSTSYGLAAYVFTNNLQNAIWLYERLEFGMVGVNDWAPQGTEAPFGGWKQSGSGHESGMEGMLEYLEKKLVTIGGL